MKELLVSVGRCLLPFAAVTLSPTTAQSPCVNTVLPIVQPDSAPDGPYYALTSFDPDGAGPLPENLVIGGYLGTDHVRMFDASAGEWVSMGAGIDNVVRRLVTMPNGDVVAGVEGVGFGTDVISVRRWNGATWTSLNSSIAGEIHALHAMPNGDLLVGGTFTAIDGVAANNIAVWNGSGWASLGGGVSGTNVRVTAFATLQNGDVVVGGEFSLAGGVAANNIARWDGATFSPLGSGLVAAPAPVSSGIEVADMVTRPNGDLFVCGRFTSAGGVAANNVALWDGASWSTLGAGLLGSTFYSGWLSSADQLPNGDIVVGATIPTLGPFFGSVQRWDGSSWTQYGPNIGEFGVQVLSMPGGLVAASSELGQFDGNIWQPIDGSGATNVQVRAVAELPNGDVVIGGIISMINGTAVSNIALWNGSSWSSMAGGVDGQVQHIAVGPSGEVIATGLFTTAGGAPANHIARWDGASWSPLGSGTPVSCVVAVQPDGGVIASGWLSPFSNIGGVAANNIARWDGSSWSPMGGGLVNSNYTYTLRAAANGDVYASSYCSDPNGPISSQALRLVRWDGSSWSAVGGTMNGIAREVLLLPDGDLAICGNFTVVGGVAANRVARWDGSAWSPYGAGISSDTYGLMRLPDGDLGVAYNSSTSPPTHHVARWNGAGWLQMVSPANDYVYDVAQGVDGDMLVAGDFTQIGGVNSPFVARISTSCPASVVTLGAGCAGSGGLNELVAESLPWTGATFEMKATGLAPLSIVAIDGGFAPLGPVPLASLGLPFAPPGCTLDISPDYFEFALTTTGELDYAWAIPNDPVFAGANIFWQFVAFEIDPSFVFLETTSTNALQLTIGTF